MRQAPEFFESEELDLIFIAKKLKEALKIEDLLTEAGIDYAVEPDTYRGGLIFASERIGAFFYVQPSASEQAKQVLSAHRYKPYEI